MLALIFTRKLRPMIIGSISGWLMLAGMIARPRATSSRTSSAGGTLAGGDERHLRGDLAGAGTLQLGAAVADHPGPRRQPGRQIDHRVRIGVGPRGVIEVEVIPGGQVDPPERNASAGHPLQFAVSLAAASDGSGGDGRFDRLGKDVSHFSSPYAGITRSGSYGRRP